MSRQDAIAAARSRLAEKAPATMAASKQAIRQAPTKEEGSPRMVMSGMGIFGGGLGAPDWGYFVDDSETAPELVWPASVEKYERMETSDAQIKGLMLATTMPVRRFRWEIDANEARPEAVELASEDLNLPVRGADRQPRRRGFNHDRHMGHSLRALGIGHYHFEEVVELRDDGLLHLVKLGTRPPRSVIGIRTDEHGNLTAIEQMTGGLPTGRVLGGIAGLGTRVLEANRLLTYLWDSKDDGDQVGNSILRACYRNWLVKDALIRVDAVKHERNAMGIPWFEVDPAASQPQIEELARRAEEIRASRLGGGAGPGKLKIAGVDGDLPDTIGSIRYHDEQMAKALLLLLYNLGGDAASGARALGDTFMDWYLQFQGAAADWYCEMTQALIDRQVERNFGPDEQSPIITYTRTETSELAFSDFALGVKEGLILPGPELSAYIEERFKVPGQKDAAEEKAAAPPPTPPPAPEPEPEGQPPAAASGPEKGSHRPRPARTALAEAITATLTAPMTWPQLARAVGSDPKNQTARRARDELIAEGVIMRGASKSGSDTLVPIVALELPDRDLKRAPLAFEVSAQVNFAAMEQTFLSGREALVAAYREAQVQQIAQLVAAVEAADGDAATLASLECDPVDVDVLAEPMMSIAEEGVASAKAEHEAQVGVNARSAFRGAEADTEALEATVRERAEAASLTLAAGLATSASKKAAAVSTLEPEAAAAVVSEHLNSLSDAALEEQLGGATMQAYNQGRASYMRAAYPKEIYGSAILDKNTCVECNAWDGHQFDTMVEAEVVFPIGGNVNCLAGLRCRCGLIAVY